ncbi:MAG: outer membrane protein assembly factor BamA [Thermoanaerobaculia bacterium]
MERFLQRPQGLMREPERMRTRHRARRRQRGAAGAFLACLLLTAGALRAQTYEGRPIQELVFEGLDALSEGTLRFYLGLEDGAQITAESLNERIHLFWDRNLVDQIEIETEDVPGGVRMVVRVEERPTLSSVEYIGLKRLERSDIIDRISRDLIRVREGDPLNKSELYRLKTVIESMYAEKGFRLADAEFQLEEVGDGSYRAIFTVDEGDKVRIVDIDFEGNTVFSDSRLRFAMKKTKESGFLTRLFKKDLYDEAEFQEDLDKVREVYKKAGYKNLVIGKPQVDIRDVAPSAKEQKRRMVITIPLEEGQRWKLGDISLEGNERFGDDLLLGMFKQPKGGWLRSNVIDEGVEAIDELYKNTGHLFAAVDYRLEERNDEVADVVVNVEEGDQFRVGRIEFEGNVKTKDKVIRRELAVQEGRILSAGALRNSLLRIKQLEFFEVDEEDPVAFKFHNEEKTADLTIKGKEGQRTELQFGAGFSEIDGFFGQLQFRTRNFLGRGETLGVNFQSGRRQDVFDISYNVPWFLDRPQSVGAQIFSRKLDYQYLTGEFVFQETQGGALTYGRRLGLFNDLTLTYSRFDSTDERSLSGSGGETQLFERDISLVRMAYTYDKRDSRLWPTQGLSYGFSVDYTGGPLGGTSNYVRPRADFSLFLPVTRKGLKTIAAFNAEAGFIENLSDDELFFSDRFFLGGENSVRGHRFRSLVVRTEDGIPVRDEFGYSVGGDRYIQFNFEYHALLGGPFRLIAFLDAGNVYGSEQSIDYDSLRKTAGFELQVNVPILGAPLRFIWSNNLDELEGDRFESFQFSVGPSF